ncbi:MAG TPA: hypothetical protein VHW01_13640 [Polyangiaceae bacterium]|jgi:hypothetical protein|nr:hypothetical protein [Polyangiaceae bacterium]
MEKSEIQARSEETAPDFLTHLRSVFGWSEEQAIEALGAYVTSDEAGKAMLRELDFATGNDSLEVA